MQQAMLERESNVTYVGLTQYCIKCGGVGKYVCVYSAPLPIYYVCIPM